MKFYKILPLNFSPTFCENLKVCVHSFSSTVRPPHIDTQLKVKFGLSHLHQNTNKKLINIHIFKLRVLM